MSRKKSTWGIIGGGLLGMTIAHRLAQQGQTVTLFEAEDGLGGLARPWQLGGITWDRHYHVILLSDQYTRSLLTELGLEDEICWVETQSGFFSDGCLHSMSNTLEFLNFPPLNLYDKIRLGATILYASRLKKWERLEKQGVADWLHTWSGRNTTEKIWLPLLRSKLGEAYHITSAAFIWATIQRMYAARKSGLKKEMFGYVPGGYARIIDAFAAQMTNENVTIKLQHKAHNISPAGNREITVKFINRAEETFDRVILTLPASHALHLCDGLTREERDRLEGIQYLGVICASLLLKKSLSKYYITNITDPGFPFTGIIEMSALVGKQAFNDYSLVYLPKYVMPFDPIFECSDQELEQLFLPPLLRMHPELQHDDLVAFQVSRARNVFALPALNYSKHLPPIQSSVPGLYILNSAHILNGTANVNETIRLVEDALAQITNSDEY